MTMEKKFELTDETMVHEGRTLHRIKALRDIYCVQGGFNRTVYAGDLGGWIEKEFNLSHNGECWVFGDAKVYDNALVNKNACITGTSEVFDKAIISGNALIMENAMVYNNAYVDKDVVVSGGSFVFNTAFITDSVRIYGNSEVCGNAELYGRILINDNASISKSRHVMCIGPLPPFKHDRIEGVSIPHNYITFYKSKDGDIHSSFGIVSGISMYTSKSYTIDKLKEFIDREVKSNHVKEAYMKAIDLAQYMIQY